MSKLLSLRIVAITLPATHCLGLLLCFLVVDESLATESSLRLVARTQESYDGGNGSRLFASLNSFSVDSLGRTAFDVYSGEQIDGVDERGIWVERDAGVLTELAYPGMPHPIGTTQYSFLPSSSAHYDEGTVVFTDWILNDPDGPRTALWKGEPNQELTLLAVDKAIPGVDAFEVVGGEPRLIGGGVAGSGHVAFRGGSSRRFYLAEPDNSARLILAESIPVPDVPGGEFRTFDGFRMNDLGQFTWSSLIDRVPLDGNFGVWKSLSEADSQLVVRRGDVAAGTDNSRYFQFLNQSIDNSGNVAFASRLSPADHTADVGVWVEKEGQGIQPLLLEGDPAPGTAGGVFFGNMDINNLANTGPAYDRSGNIAIRAKLIGEGVTLENDSGIWATDGEDLRLVIREGEAAPGTEPGVVFDRFDATTGYGVNKHGQVFFEAFLKGPSIDPNRNDRGIWAETVAGQLELIARRGDTLTDNLGEEFFIRAINFNPARFGQNGHLAFHAIIDDSNQIGLFVSSAVAVPEPSSFMLLLVACFLLSRANGNRSDFDDRRTLLA